MRSMNKVILIGNLGRDPEVRTFDNGGKICNLRVATSEQWKDRQTGEKRERTEWHSVTLHQEGAINFAEQYLRKGSKVMIEGKLETRKWQAQDGTDRYSTEIAVRPYSGSIGGLDSAPPADRGNGDQGGYQDYSPPQNQNQGGGGAPMDDEIPFAPEWRI